MLEILQNLLDASWSVIEFEKNYYPYFMDELPDKYLSFEDIDFFGTIQEKLDFTALDPDSESRKYGWINYEEYITLVKKIIKETIEKDSEISRDISEILG